MKFSVFAAIAALSMAQPASAATSFDLDFTGLSTGWNTYQVNDWLQARVHIVDADPNFVGAGSVAADYVQVVSLDWRIFIFDGFDVFRPGDATDEYVFSFRTLGGGYPEYFFGVPAGQSQTHIDFPYSSFLTGAYTREIIDGQITHVSFHTDEGSVPEPATWAMMIVGFGLAGAGLRRRRVAAAV